jgi:hypothetical protein
MGRKKKIEKKKKKYFRAKFSSPHEVLGDFLILTPKF